MLVQVGTRRARRVRPVLAPLVGEGLDDTKRILLHGLVEVDVLLDPRQHVRRAPAQAQRPVDPLGLVGLLWRRNLAPVLRKDLDLALVRPLLKVRQIFCEVRVDPRLQRQRALAVPTVADGDELAGLDVGGRRRRGLAPLAREATSIGRLGAAVPRIHGKERQAALLRRGGVGARRARATRRRGLDQRPNGLADRARWNRTGARRRRRCDFLGHGFGLLRHHDRASVGVARPRERGTAARRAARAARAAEAEAEAALAARATLAARAAAALGLGVGTGARLADECVATDRDVHGRRRLVAPAALFHEHVGGVRAQQGREPADGPEHADFPVFEHGILFFSLSGHHGRQERAENEGVTLHFLEFVDYDVWDRGFVTLHSIFFFTQR